MATQAMLDLAEPVYWDAGARPTLCGPAGHTQSGWDGVLGCVSKAWPAWPHRPCSTSLDLVRLLD